MRNSLVAKCKVLYSWTSALLAYGFVGNVYGLLVF